MSAVGAGVADLARAKSAAASGIPMRLLVAAVLVFVSGFAVMVLEIIGARYLAKDFGSSLYVWTSQIGLILIALALGYYAGGALADRDGRLRWLGLLQVPAGIATLLIPNYADSLINIIIGRHSLGAPIPPLWLKLDPALGSALIFLFPCFALALLPPYLIRWTGRTVGQLGRTSGAVIAASTVGSIAGVFCSGYILLDVMRVSDIFRALGVLNILLGLSCLAVDRWFGVKGDASPPRDQPATTP